MDYSIIETINISKSIKIYWLQNLKISNNTNPSHTMYYLSTPWMSMTGHKCKLRLISRRLSVDILVRHSSTDLQIIWLSNLLTMSLLDEEIRYLRFPPLLRHPFNCLKIYHLVYIRYSINWFHLFIANNSQYIKLLLVFYVKCSW